MAEIFIPKDPACSHPNGINKGFDSDKAISWCATCNGGQNCPFLVPKMAFEGREGEFIKLTKREKRIFPGD